MERVARELESESVSDRGRANVRTLFRTYACVSTLSRHLTTPPTTALPLDAAKQSGSRTLQVLDHAVVAHAVTRDESRTRANSNRADSIHRAEVRGESRKSTLARADNLESAWARVIDARFASDLPQFALVLAAISISSSINLDRTKILMEPLNRVHFDLFRVLRA